MRIGWLNVSIAQNSFWYFKRFRTVIFAQIMALNICNIKVIALDFMDFPKILVSEPYPKSHLGHKHFSLVLNTTSSGFQKLASF